MEHKRKNQYKPLPSLEDIGPHILTYWKMRKTDKQMLSILQEKHIDMSKYGLGLSSLKSMRKRMNLVSTRGQKHTLESIQPAMIELRVLYPKAGAREMVSILFHEMGMCVSRHLVVLYFRVFEGKLMKERKAGRLKRRRFWSAGVNDLWAVDQHDKWKRFGLALHTGIDPFPGKIHWVKVWWNNNNPKLILSYYLEAVEKLGHFPFITQSDPGSENYGIANAQSVMRQWNDYRLKGYIQHRWMRHKKNVMPEIGWSQLRRRFTPGFEDLLEQGVINGWYDITRPIDALTFRWLFIPWLQVQFDGWTDRVNNTKKRADKNKILPHGPPNDIVLCPERYGALDFKVEAQPAAIAHVRALYAPPDDPVFALVPHEFGCYANDVYKIIGSPILSRDNIWDVYLTMRDRLEDLHNRKDEDLEYLEQWEIQDKLVAAAEDKDEVQIPYELIPGEDLAGGIENADEDGNFYMGGVNGGLGLDTAMNQKLDALDSDDDNDFEFEKVSAYFSTDDEDDKEDGFEW